MRLNEYDQPVLAVINAANDMVGQTEHVIFFKDAWRAAGGGDGRMWDAVELVAANHPESIEIIYKAKPYSHIDVFIKIIAPIRPKYK